VLAHKPTKTDREASPGALVVFFDAPDTPATRRWLFGEHAKAVLDNVPGVWRTRSFEILNPERPGEPRWLTILETDDIEATWRFRWLASGQKAKAEATKRGVARRQEYFVRLANDKSKARAR
jgi:hypothetical protein